MLAQRQHASSWFSQQREKGASMPHWYVSSQKSTGCKTLKILIPNGEAVADLATVVVWCSVAVSVHDCCQLKLNMTCSGF